MWQIQENPYPALVLGALVLGFLVVGYLASPRRIWWAAIVPVVLAMIGVVLTDVLIETDQEQLTRIVHEAAKHVKDNHPEKLWEYLSPRLDESISQKDRNRLDRIFQQVEFTGAKASNLEIDINELTTPPSAEVYMLVSVKFQARHGESPLDRYVGRLKVTFERLDKRWYIVDGEEIPLVKN